MLFFKAFPFLENISGSMVGGDKKFKLTILMGKWKSNALMLLNFHYKWDGIRGEKRFYIVKFKPGV